MSNNTPHKRQKIKQVVNIRQALREFASDTYTPIKECDFTLHGVATYIKTSGMEAFGKYNVKQREIYKDLERLINDRVVFRQMYQISLHHKTTCEIELEYTIEKDPYLTHPILMIEPTSIIPYKQYKPQELFNLLIKEINKIKALSGILVGIFSDAMVQDVKKLVKEIYTNQFKESASILLFSGIEPELAEPSELTFHFEDKNKDRQIKEVEVGELIVEYKKPVFGKNGLNAQGKQIHRGNFDNEEFLKCTVDEETIDRIEDDEQILLYSKKRGFVNYTRKLIEISNKVTMEKVKRVQSQITKEEQNEVEIVLTQNDINEDTVGEGVQLKSETIQSRALSLTRHNLKPKPWLSTGLPITAPSCSQKMRRSTATKGFYDVTRPPSNCLKGVKCMRRTSRSKLLWAVRSMPRTSSFTLSSTISKSMRPVP
jgi:hypothetical protein